MKDKGGRRVFKYLCLLPLGLFVVLRIYVNSFEGWGQWAAAPVLLLPVVLSFCFGVWGGAMLWNAKKSKQPLMAMAIQTGLAVGLALWFLAKLMIVEISRSFF